MTEPLEAQVGQWLRKRDLKLAVAESCSGGLLSDSITNIPGSSYYFVGGVTAYSYEFKERALHVRHTTLAKHGAVSRETVLEMAQGVRQIVAADCPIEEMVGLSISGIAGPGGAKPGKPVGLVWLGLSAPDGDWARHFYFNGDRLQVKAQSVQAALQFLLDYLRGDVLAEA